VTSLNDSQPFKKLNINEEENSEFGKIYLLKISRRFFYFLIKKNFTKYQITFFG